MTRSAHKVKLNVTSKICCANCHGFSGHTEPEKRAWLATTCPATYSRPHPSHSTRWVTAQADLICLKCGLGLQGFGLRGVCKRNAKEHPLRRSAVEAEELQLVTEMASKDSLVPQAIWKKAASAATADIGNSVGGGARCTGDRGEEVATADIGNSVGGGEPCTEEGDLLHVVLGGRDFDLDNPEGDPFALLEEEEA